MEQYTRHFSVSGASPSAEHAAIFFDIVAVTACMMMHTMAGRLHPRTGGLGSRICYGAVCLDLVLVRAIFLQSAAVLRTSVLTSGHGLFLSDLGVHNIFGLEAMLRVPHAF